MRNVAAMLAALMLVSCSVGNEPEPRSSTTPAGMDASGEVTPSGPVTVRLTGDLEASFGMTVDPEDFVSRDSSEALARAWDEGALELPRARFVSGDHSVVMSWPGWEDHHDPSRVSLTFRFHGYLASPDPGQCAVQLDRPERYVLRGTIECAGLVGVKPGAEEKPVFDVRLDVDHDVAVCVSQESEEFPGQFDCLQP